MLNIFNIINSNDDILIFKHLKIEEGKCLKYNFTKMSGNKYRRSDKTIKSQFYNKLPT